VKLQRVELSNEFAAGHSGIRAYILNEIAVHCLMNGIFGNWPVRKSVSRKLDFSGVGTYVKWAFLEKDPFHLRSA
jgi:hypothetical protein